MHKNYALIILLLCMNMVAPASGAVEKTASAKFHGTLIVVECSINSGKRQTVDFGDAVGIHRIDGKRYEQPVPFSLDCKNYAGGQMPTMTLKAEGTATTFNEAALTTNINGLGIELRSNGTALPLNKEVNLDYSNVPSLSAVPVVDPSVELQEQPFTATVRLTVEVP
ncbi:fimbrial protein [Enterobacter cloacae]|nr:fimbrial protein [Enterobacter cloacae]